IEASSEPVVQFSWHGGEPTVLGLDYFRRIVELQIKHCPPGQRLFNGIQTNGTLISESWCRFFKEAGFGVGISMDGPRDIHDRNRGAKDGKPSFDQVLRGYELLLRYKIPCDILCVVNSYSVSQPLEILRFFRNIRARYVSFLPLVEPQPEAEGGVSPRTVPAEAWGDFLCAVFDEWMLRDIGQLKVQIIEEAARIAFEQEHSLCIFRPTCGDIPVVEHNGDFFSCDHFVDPEHCLGNIGETPLVELLESPAQRGFGQSKLDTLPQYCRACEVREMCNGECPKNRFIETPDGEAGLNYLCAGYKRFFSRCQLFVSEVAAQWRNPLAGQPRAATHARSVQAESHPGRNDPCPCGSGVKYKKCCMGKTS
ncbi:MAG: anaerobic sulfatase maturase, partial [Candidatus Latescibacterota bacterium]